MRKKNYSFPIQKKKKLRLNDFSQLVFSFSQEKKMIHSYFGLYANGF